MQKTQTKKTETKFPHQQYLQKNKSCFPALRKGATRWRNSYGIIHLDSWLPWLWRLCTAWVVSGLVGDRQSFMGSVGASLLSFRSSEGKQRGAALLSPLQWFSSRGCRLEKISSQSGSWSDGEASRVSSQVWFSGVHRMDRRHAENRLVHRWNTGCILNLSLS